MIKRVFLTVLDSVGAGFTPDSYLFGDDGANTLKSLSNSGKLNIPNLKKLGIGNAEGLTFLGEAKNPKGAYGKCMPLSNGKDTTTGHWEISGIITEKPFPTFPEGFPEDFMNEFQKKINIPLLCNKPYSGTEVIKDYGREAIEKKALICYTSADSVFQIAAHEDIFPREKLYEICTVARKMLQGNLGVGRVIARPFKGNWPDFIRTDGRHDFSLEPTGETMLDILKENKMDVLSVGKIYDIFHGRSITSSRPTRGNRDGFSKIRECMNEDFNGISFINLVDFDMIYGHRRDLSGYVNALNEYDLFLGEMLEKMRETDLLIITADHGCDPLYKGTDHTREYTPLILYNENIRPVNLGVQRGYGTIAKTILDIFGIENTLPFKSFKKEIFE